jgi:hypothetical protein
VNHKFIGESRDFKVWMRVAGLHSGESGDLVVGFRTEDFRESE